MDILVAESRRNAGLSAADADRRMAAMLRSNQEDPLVRRVLDDAEQRYTLFAFAMLVAHFQAW